MTRKRVKSRNLSESILDERWLTLVGRLPVRAVVSWSCYVTTKKCPMIYCNDDETQQHLLIDCYRAQEVWNTLRTFGIHFDVNFNSVMYCIIKENLPSKHKEMMQLVIFYGMCWTCEQSTANLIRVGMRTMGS